jgi:CMP/dCMP kinase
MSVRTTTVLTISRQLGSGGSFIGQAVANRLRIRYADREILQQAARSAGLQEGDLAPKEEKAAGIWEAVLHSFSLGGPDATYVPPTTPSVYEVDLFELESVIIREIASRYDAVIVGRAGFHVLAGHAGAVHVMVHARREWRAGRIMEVRRLADRHEAEAMIERSDRQRAQFIRTFTGRNWSDALAFDLCLDTSVIGLESATDLVALLVEQRMARQRGTTTGTDA